MSFLNSRRARRGTNALGYALMAGLVALVALGSIASLGGGVNSLMTNVSNRLANVQADQPSAPAGNSGGSGSSNPGAAANLAITIQDGVANQVDNDGPPKILVLRVTNEGAAASDYIDSAVRLTGNDADSFRMINLCWSILEPGASCQVELWNIDPDPGAKSATLNILAHNQPSLAISGVTTDSPAQQGRRQAMNAVYSCATGRGNVYFRYAYGGETSVDDYLYFYPVGSAMGSLDASTTNCQNPNLTQTFAMTACVFFAAPIGRWSLYLGSASAVVGGMPASVTDTITTAHDCDREQLQPGVTAAECKGVYTCTKMP